MGMCSSAKFVLQPSTPGQDQIAYDIFMRLNLTQLEINSFYDIFLQMNKTSTPYLSFTEFSAFLKLEESDLMKYLFNLFISKSSLPPPSSPTSSLALPPTSGGKIDFCQFVCTIWNFLSLESMNLSAYAFLLFHSYAIPSPPLPSSSTSKISKEESLPPDDITKIIEIIHRKKYSDNAGVQTLCDEIRVISRSITFKQFTSFAKLHPSMCGPLAAIQFLLQKNLLGDTFWTRLQRRRSNNVKLSSPKYLIKLYSTIYEKYHKQELNKKVKQMKAENKMKGSQHGKSKQDLITRSRHDDMLDYFQLNPNRKKHGASVGRAKKYFRKPTAGASSSLRNSAKIEVWKDHDSDEDLDDDSDEEDDDGDDDEIDHQGPEDKDSNGEDGDKEKERTSTTMSPTHLSPSPPPPASASASVPAEPQAISSTSLRRTLIMKQNPADSAASSSRKTLFHPSTLPRKTMINGVMKIVPSDATAESSQAPPSTPSTPSTPATASQSNSQIITPKPRQSMVVSHTNSTPLPAISNNRKTLIQATTSLPEKSNFSQRRSTKLEPIQR